MALFFSYTSSLMTTSTAFIKLVNHTLGKFYESSDIAFDVSKTFNHIRHTKRLSKLTSYSICIMTASILMKLAGLVPSPLKHSRFTYLPSHQPPSLPGTTHHSLHSILSSLPKTLSLWDSFAAYVMPMTLVGQLPSHIAPSSESRQ